jgi:hypothetical protein
MDIVSRFVSPYTPHKNRDLATVVDNESVLNCIQTHKVSLSKAYCIAEPGDTSLNAENEAWADYFSSYITTGEEPMEPISDFYYPIIDDLLDFLDLRSDPNYNTADHKVGGIMSQSAYWRDFIKDILPQGSNGMVAVFESGCNPTFTYEINGPLVRYMGVGDFHDAQYDDMVTSSTLQNLNEFYVGDTSYSYVQLEQNLCPWTVYVYPSQTMEDSFRTQNPAIFTSVVIAIFAFLLQPCSCFMITS